MAKVTGVFDAFDSLDKIPYEDIARWLHPMPKPLTLQNFLANRIFYPQAVPITEADMNIDLAILREALKRNPSYFNPQQKKIFIPATFLTRFPEVLSLTLAFIDAFLPKDIYQVILTKKEKDEILGSVIVPQFLGSQSIIQITINNKNYSLKKGEVKVLPCEGKCTCTFQSKDAKIEVFGGSLGILIDGRIK